MPVTDINPATVMVNGVAFPNATLDARPQHGRLAQRHPGRHHHDHSPVGAEAHRRHAGRSRSPARPWRPRRCPNYTWTGTATVTVTGELVAAAPRRWPPRRHGPVLETTFNSPFGPTQYDADPLARSRPTTTSRSRCRVALAAVPAVPGFRERLYSFNHPGKKLKNVLTNRGHAATGLFGDRTDRVRIFVKHDPRPQPVPRQKSTPGLTRRPTPAASQGRRADSS